MAESLQKKLDRVRPPRVQITYDVEIGDAIQTKELPFVLGVMGDYAGQPTEPLPRLKDRKFVDIHKGNFDAVMKGMRPRLVYRVDNKLAKDGTQLPVELTFESMADFDPEQVARKVEPLRKLVEMRERLSDLKNKLYGNDKLGDLLQDVVQSTEKLTALGAETRHGGGGAEGDGEAKT
ncbi:MAG TPA: type VI secretion system contractile sheath small subunit [Geminicoccaceae bacterium]|jgi:type VI secretion system protein ImpB|nr:type VI secretion system contractile sheath small subunit [Geminicoccaceae bacterium]